MLTFSSRSRIVALAIGILITNQAAPFGLQTAKDLKNNIAKVIPNKKKAALVFITISVFAGFSRLWSKGSKFDYHASDLKKDIKKLLASSSFAEFRANLLEFIDKWIVGRAVSLNDVSYSYTAEDGRKVSEKDKKLKATPFGLFGLFHAYVLLPLEKMAKISGDWDKVIVGVILGKILADARAGSVIVPGAN